MREWVIIPCDTRPEYGLGRHVIVWIVTFWTYTIGGLKLTSKYSILKAVM
jgi:hypothetical protein